MERSLQWVWAAARALVFVPEDPADKLARLVTQIGLFVVACVLGALAYQAATDVTYQGGAVKDLGLAAVLAAVALSQIPPPGAGRSILTTAVLVVLVVWFRAGVLNEVGISGLVTSGVTPLACVYLGDLAWWMHRRAERRWNKAVLASGACPGAQS